MLQVGRHVDEGAFASLLLLGAQFQRGVPLEKQEGGRVGSGMGGKLLTGGEAKQNHLAPLIAVQGLAEDAIFGNCGLLAEVAHMHVRIGHWMRCFFFHTFSFPLEFEVSCAGGPPPPEALPGGGRGARKTTPSPPASRISMT